MLVDRNITLIIILGGENVETTEENYDHLLRDYTKVFQRYPVFACRVLNPTNSYFFFFIGSKGSWFLFL